MLFYGRCSAELVVAAQSPAGRIVQLKKHRVALPSIHERHASEARLTAPATLNPAKEDPLATDSHDGSGAMDNPFKVPQDETIFRMREDEKKARRQHAESMKTLSVQEKSTFASRMAATVGEGTKARMPPRRPPPLPADREQTLAGAAMPGDRWRRDHERMADFITKKREIFLVQMSLDTKRAEIRKLEEHVLQREDALKKSEQMLEDDAVQFDQFLRENESKVNDAIKRADLEAKRRAEKQMEIKRLNASIAARRSELNKYEEQLQDCERYKKVLDNITPASFFEALANRKQLKRQQLDDRWREECQAVKQRKEDAKMAKAQAEDDYANARTQQEAERAEKAIKETTINLKAVLKEREPPAPVHTDEVDADEEAAMHFQDPQQLLDILSDLEEQNLFLIQNAQEVEEALDALKNTFKKQREKMFHEVDSLRAQIHSLESLIEQETEKVAILRERTQQSDGSMLMGHHDVSLDALTAKVVEMYRCCGFDFDPSASTLQMLTNIEMRMEEYLTQVHQIPEEFWESHEKQHEKERRQEAREEKIQLQKQEHERRVKKALERAAAPVYKKVGKPVMTRSQPVRKAKVVKEDGRDEDEIELEAFLAREML